MLVLKLTKRLMKWATKHLLLRVMIGGCGRDFSSQVRDLVLQRQPPYYGLVSLKLTHRNASNMQATGETIHAYVDQKRSSRNSNLALLKFLAQNAGKEPAMSEQLLSACKRYFEDNCTRFICFDDLRPYVEHLSDTDQEALRIHFASHAKGLSPIADASEVASNKTSHMKIADKEPQAVGISWLASEINSLKTDYMLKVSKIRSKTILEAFVCNCIRLYKVSMSLGNDRVYSDNKPGDDACILAVMGLVLLSETVHKRYLIHITPLLEFLLERSKHNYQALLILVRVYIMLGAGSLAMKTYRRLAIKHLQHETLSHVLFTRLATIHPHPTHMVNNSSVEKKDKDPVEGLGVALESYRSSARQSAFGKRIFLEKGRYNMLLGALQVEETMKRSFCKVMWVLERRRMKRFAHYADDEDYFDLLGNEGSRSFLQVRNVC